MREKFIRFMQGRYGAYGLDSFSKFLFGATMVFIVLSMFSTIRGSSVVSLLLLVYMYFRLFSKNYAKRYAENQMFLKYTAGIRQKFAKQKSTMQQKKSYHIYKCPDCRQKIRIPRGKGKIMVKCPKCNKEFMKNS